MTDDLTPSQAARLDPTTVLGIVTAAGSPLSHGAILARALGIPAVVGAGHDVLDVPDGTTILVDGTEGVVVIELVRAGMHHPITVLFPMVTTIDELRAARALLVEAAAEVGSPAGELPPGFEVGAMAEVPAFALHARAAVPLVDLISIGTDDLTQYTLTAERGNGEGPSRCMRRVGRRPRLRRPTHRPRRPQTQHDPARHPRRQRRHPLDVGQQGETTRRPRAPPRLGCQCPSPPQRPRLTPKARTRCSELRSPRAHSNASRATIASVADGMARISSLIFDAA